MANKKYYEVCVLNGNWEELHKELCKETECEFIPNRIVECYDEVNHSKNRARYLLTDEEAESLRNHPEVKYVDLDLTFYPELEPKNTLFGNFTKRQYTNTVGWPRIHRTPRDTVNLTNLDSEIKRTSWGLKRVEETSNNFFNNSSSANQSTSPIYTKFTADGTVISLIDSTFKTTLGEEQESPTTLQTKQYTQFLRDNSESPSAILPASIIKYYGAELKSVNYLKSGQNIDVVVIDNGVLQYHPEFTDRFNKISGASGERLFQGRSRVRDLILDGPYYLDPEYFDANTTYKTFKKDGRPTCTREGAFGWWTSINKRSSKFSSVGTISYSSIQSIIENTNKTNNYFEENVIGGPPSPGHETFGDALKADPFNQNNFAHGTPCAGVCAGKDYGSAVDARIWNLCIKTLNIGWVSNSIAWEFVKIFHAAKKTCLETDVRYSGGSFANKIKYSPTILNQSFGTPTSIESDFNRILSDLDDAWTSGSTGPFNGNQYTYNQFFNGVQTSYTMTVSQVTVSGQRETKVILDNIKDVFLFSKRMLDEGNRDSQFYAAPSPTGIKQSIEEALAEGVIAVTAGGNEAQYYSVKNSPNYIVVPDYLDGSTIATQTIQPHEKGFPADGGGFLVGASNNLITLDTNGTVRETITPWTSRGDSIDVFAPGSQVLSPSNDYDYLRYDARDNGKIDLFTESEANQYGRFYDSIFAGTSCATPMVVGVMALRLEEKPDSTETELRTWLNTQGSTTGAFYNPIPSENNARYFRSKFNLVGSPNRMLRNPYVEKVYSLELTNQTILDTAIRSSDKFYSDLGLSRDSAIELLENPPDSNDSNYGAFANLVYLLDTQSPASLSPYRTVKVSFGGRNNGGNAKFERQVEGTRTFYAMGGGGGGGFYGGGGGNKGGAGGGGSGLAREDATVAKTRQGGNSGEGFARIWLNEKSDRSRDDFNKDLTTR